jgi:ribosome-interacting GTPase 1
MKFNDAKIYKIESDVGDKIYIGQTKKKLLCDRMSSHRYDYKKWKANEKTRCTSFELFDEYGLENCRIVLLENCPSNSTDDIKAREAFYIRTLNCVNKAIPDRTRAEYRNDPVHKQRKAELSKISCEKNKEVLKTKLICECGTSCATVHKLKHEKSTKHKNYLLSLKPV